MLSTQTVEPETQAEGAPSSRALGPWERFFKFANLEPLTTTNRPRPVLDSRKPRRPRHGQKLTSSNFEFRPLRIESDETERDRIDLLESESGQSRGVISQGQGRDQFQGRLLSLPGYGTEQRLAGGPQPQVEVIHDHEFSLDNDPVYTDRRYID